ncbi:MAG TPA: hypothetical protein VF508_02740, partial [Pyrinomonadaceae bacterium]
MNFLKHLFHGSLAPAAATPETTGLVKYLLPENPFAFAIVIFLVIVFVVWALWLVRWMVWMSRQQGVIRRAEEVETLAGALRARLAQSRDEPEPRVLSKAEADAAFAEFCQANLLDERGPVAQHLKAIFDAGWNESRLDADALLRHTTGEIFSANNSLRSILSTFIVFGVLGTLFGLANSLAQLKPPEQVAGAAGQAWASQGLGQLLGELQSAFAPSIWGVGFTIIGVFLFNLYLQFSAAPVAKRLEQVTLTLWIPRLYPTTSQRLLETLQLSERQMEKNYQAANRVAEFADSIEGRAGDLNQSLAGASSAVGSLSASAANINEFAGRFADGVNALLPFQQEAGELYRRLIADSKAFHDSVREDNARAEATQRGMQTVLDGLSAQLNAIMGGLRSYEAAYVQERQGIDAKIQEVLVAARRAFDDLAVRNQEVVGAVAGPLREELAGRLGGIEETLRVQLRSIQDRFGELKPPLDEAAGKIEGSLESVVRRTETLTREMNTKFLEQNRTHLEQLRSLNEFNAQVPTLATELASAATLHASHAQSLSETMTDVRQDVGALNGSLGSLLQAVTLPERDDAEVSAAQAGVILLRLLRDS